MKGLTLVEVLVSSAILILLLASVITVLNVGNQSWQQDEEMLNLQQQARLAMNGMAREIRQGSDINITAGGEAVEFCVPDSTNTVKYTFSSGQIIREHPTAVMKVLANDISNVNFCCWDSGSCGLDCSSSSVLQIQLRAAKTVRQRLLTFPATGNLTEKVRLRNE